jgi:16S rRNA (guanine527-N7)-methyltransferase
VKQRLFAAAEFQTATNVSRETLDRCKIYVDLLHEWSGRMNLVARSTLDDVWHRHMLDSAQLFPLIPVGTKTLVDLGSGAGFPGLLMSIMGISGVHLVESTGKKALFLQTVVNETGISAKIHNDRIEALRPFIADVITARALAPLDKLLNYAAPFSGPNTLHLYHKGQHVGHELTKAHKIWNIKVDLIPSSTDPQGSVLSVCEVSRVKPDRF